MESAKSKPLDPASSKTPDSEGLKKQQSSQGSITYEKTVDFAGFTNLKPCNIQNLALCRLGPHNYKAQIMRLGDRHDIYILHRIMYHCTSFLPCSRMGPIYKINIQILS
jgi:hypothetical protein